MELHPVGSLREALSAHPGAVLVLGPSGSGSGRSILGGGVLDDFILDRRVTALLASAQVTTVPYYAFYPPFLLEEEVCQGLLYRGSIRGSGPESRTGVTLATWPVTP